MTIRPAGTMHSQTFFSPFPTTAYTSVTFFTRCHQQWRECQVHYFYGISNYFINSCCHKPSYSWTNIKSPLPSPAGTVVGTTVVKYMFLCLAAAIRTNNGLRICKDWVKRWSFQPSAFAIVVAKFGSFPRAVASSLQRI